MWASVAVALAQGALGCTESGRPNTASASALIELPSMLVESSPMMGGLPKPLTRGDTFRRGLVLGPLETPENDEHFKRRYGQLLDRAVTMGVTDLQLVVRWLQVDYTALEMAPFESVHDELLTWLIEGARRRKLRVMLAPRLEVELEGTHSGRALKPSNWEHWWWSYRRVALHYAKVAATRRVATYAIGSELSSTEAQGERWRKLIKEVRKIYKGELTYLAAPESVEHVPFWDALDVVGVLIDQAQPRNEEQLAERLAPLIKRLRRTPKLEERGYVVSEQACGKGDSEPARELLCQYALFQGFRDEPQLGGMYVLPPAELSLPKSDNRAPAGSKPPDAPAVSATDLITHWFKKSRS
jgi:hypothetical protein